MALCLMFPYSVAAQFDDAGEILRSGVDDANILLTEYLKPFGKGFGTGMNSGWINTARPYKRFGFDLRVNLAVAVVPTSNRSFNVDNLALSNLKRIGGPPDSQTAFGKKLPGSEMGIFLDNSANGERVMVESFEMPEGTGFPYVPSPMIQLTVGFIKDTDLSIRYIMPLKFEESNLSLFGFGAKHGLNQWLPFGDTLPFDLSLQFGYTKLNAVVDLHVTPSEQPDVYDPYKNNPDVWNGQSIDFNASALTGNLLIGRNFKIISFYGGLGYQTSRVSITSPGSYPVVNINPDFDPNTTAEAERQLIIDRLDDPLNLVFDGTDSLQALAGFRIRILILTISGSYRLSHYPTASLGVGLSLR